MIYKSGNIYNNTKPGEIFYTSDFIVILISLAIKFFNVYFKKRYIMLFSGFFKLINQSIPFYLHLLKFKKINTFF